MAKKENNIQLNEQEIEDIQGMLEQEVEHLEVKSLEKKIKEKTDKENEEKNVIGLDKFTNRGKLVKCNGNSYRILPIMIQDLDIFYGGLLYVPQVEEDKVPKLTDWGINSFDMYKSLFEIMVEKYCMYDDKAHVTPQLQKDLCWGLDEMKMFLSNWVEVSE